MFHLKQLLLICTTFIAAFNVCAFHVETQNLQVNKLLDGHQNQGKHIIIKPVELADSAGLVYLGGIVPKAQILEYLEQMRDELGADFAKYRRNQAARDHSLFHLTLVNPYEYQTVSKHDIDLNTSIKVVYRD